MDFSTVVALESFFLTLGGVSILFSSEDILQRCVCWSAAMHLKCILQIFQLYLRTSYTCHTYCNFCLSCYTLCNTCFSLPMLLAILSIPMEPVETQVADYFAAFVTKILTKYCSLPTLPNNIVPQPLSTTARAITVSMVNHSHTKWKALNLLSNVHLGSTSLGTSQVTLMSCTTTVVILVTNITLKSLIQKIFPSQPKTWQKIKSTRSTTWSHQLATKPMHAIFCSPNFANIYLMWSCHSCTITITSLW